ncbi:ATP-binding protein [Gordonia oryzae]|uniref:ATP-binding protein n=1 Tax=Gordonia oryzae TaxID=2487349 RepID=A0A3N4GAU2_9ACTN|nr:ATP-binding protein [Gordonia oryzae]RPA58507.1 ATP-binding protein [Gordonia oryzae]
MPRSPESVTPVSTGLDHIFPPWLRLDDLDPVGPLWRAAQIFRLASFGYALGFQIVVNHDLDRPGLTWALFGLLTVANIWWAAGYLVGFGRRWWFVASEVAVSAVMMLSTSYVADMAWVANNQTWPTTLWMTNCVLSSALLGGPWWGLLGGAAVGLTNFYVKGEIVLNFGRNATALLLLMTGMAIGLAASRARVTHERLTTAIRAAAQAAERERLAREVHDGVLQVLALVSRRGTEIGGETAQLAGLAAQQEQRLRRLIAARPADGGSDTQTDLGAALQALAADGVSVSAPPDPVPLPATVLAEVMSAIDNILTNSALHAGPEAHSYVLLEDLDEEVIISVRDTGLGIAPGRLAQARSEGRMGIDRSIVGRIEHLGGRAQLHSAPGMGTEWELTIPVEKGRRR